MTRSAFDDLAHRLANLLGTIQIQVEVARLDGSIEGYREALRLIEQSAVRAQQELRQLQERQRGEAGS